MQLVYSVQYGRAPASFGLMSVVHEFFLRKSISVVVYVNNELVVVEVQFNIYLSGFGVFRQVVQQFVVNAKDRKSERVGKTMSSDMAD